MHVPRPGEERDWYVGRGQRGHRAEGGEDRAVPAARQRHRHAGGRLRADDDGADVDPLPGQLVKHERAGRVVADCRDKRDVQPEPRRGDRGNRGGSADHQVDAAHQLLLLTEGGRHVAAEYQHIRIAVAEHHQVHRPCIKR